MTNGSVAADYNESRSYHLHKNGSGLVEKEV